MTPKLRLVRLAPVMAMVLVLGACAAPVSETGQCEPGVSGISHSTDVTPGGC